MVLWSELGVVVVGESILNSSLPELWSASAMYLEQNVLECGRVPPKGVYDMYMPSVSNSTLEACALSQNALTLEYSSSVSVMLSLS